MSSKTAQVAKPLRCPECSSVLSVEQLVVRDESGPQSVFFMSCPRGDFTAAVTDKELVAVVIDIVMEHLNQETSSAGQGPVAF